MLVLLCSPNLTFRRASELITCFNSEQNECSSFLSFYDPFLLNPLILYFLSGEIGAYRIFVGSSFSITNDFSSLGFGGLFIVWNLAESLDAQ